MAKSPFLGPNRAPKGDLAFVQGFLRRYVIQALNTLERIRRARIYARDRRTKPRLIAQGDSWFCYPLPKPIDTLQHLSSDYAVKTLAGGARRITTMAQPHQLRRLTRSIQEEQPIAMLLSAGGVDLLDLLNARATRRLTTGTAFSADSPDWLNHADLTPALAEIEGRLVQVAETALAAGVPHVLLIGYDRLRVWPTPGQSLRDSLDMIGVPKVEQQAASDKLLDLLFETHAKAAARVPGLTYLPMKDQAGPKEDWADEVHASSDGYKRVAALIKAALEDLVSPI